MNITYYGYIYKTIIHTTEGIRIYIGQHKWNKYPEIDLNYWGTGTKILDWLKKHYKVTQGRFVDINIVDKNILQREILAWAKNKEQLDNLEKEFIQPHLNKEYCWNLVDGGSTPIWTEEARLHLSNALKGKKVSEETRKKLGRAFKGKKQSPEAIKARTKTFKGKKHSKLWCQHIKDGLKGKVGKPCSEETKEKLRAINKGKVLSKEHREKISKAHKGKTHTEEYKKKRSLRQLGTKLYNNGKIHKWAKEWPGEGWVLGKINKKNY